jgi:small GTP-binding protein
MDDKLNNNENNNQKNDTIKEAKHKKKRNKDLKIIIVGNSGTGKTSLVNKYIHNKFAETYSPTIASQFSYKIYKKDDVIYRVQFWDIAGQDKNPETTGIFCQNTKGIVLCCEVNNIETRNDTIKWKESIEKNINIENIPIILVENKCDLLGEDESKYNKDLDELNIFGENNNLNKCFRTSALNGFNVEESFNFLIDEIIRMFGNDNSNERKDTVKLKNEGQQQTNIRSQQKNKCC